MLCCLQLLGFNCLRVPFSFTDLFTLTPRNFAGACAPATEAQLRANTAPAGQGANQALPRQVNTQCQDQTLPVLFMKP